MKLTSVALTASLIAVHTFAQDPIGPARSSKANWENVRSLAADSEIRVTTAAGETLRGALLGATNDALTVAVPSGTQSGERVLDRASVKSAALKREGHRLHHALIGAGIGAAGGLGITLAIGTSGSPGCIGNGGTGCLVTPPLFAAAAGFLIGAAWPSSGGREVYRSK